MNTNNGSITIYPTATFENDIYGDFEYVCNLVNYLTGEVIQRKEGIYDLSAPVTFENLAPGKYKAYFSYKIGECVLGTGTDFLKGAEILSLTEPEYLADMKSITPVSCEGGSDGLAIFYLKNWKENTYRWTFKRPLSPTADSDITASPVAGEDYATYYMSHLGEGLHTIVVKDLCGNLVFEDEADIKAIDKGSLTHTIAVAPYSCGGKSDGSITFNFSNWYDGYKAFVNGSEVTEKTTFVVDLEKHTASYTVSDLGENDELTVSASDLCGGGIEETTYNFQELSKANGLFYLKSAAVRANAECYVKNRTIDFVVEGGEPRYSYRLIDKKTGEVVYSLDAYSASNTTSVLADGEYKFIASDANGCTDEISEGLDVTSSRTLKASKTTLCGKYIHVDLDYSGTLLSAGVHLKSYNDNPTTKKVTFDENSDNKYFFYEGECDYMAGDFSPYGCQAYASLEEEVEEEPLTIGFGRLPEIEHQSCSNNGGGSYTFYPRSQMSLRGYKLVLVVTNKDTKTPYESNRADNAGTALTVSNLPAGEYEAYLALVYEDCIVESSKMAVDDFTIEDASKITIDVAEVRCSGKVFSNVNWGSDMESVAMYDAEDNMTSIPMSRGVTSAVIEGSFEKAVLTTLNGCEKNATLNKADETDNLVASFKKITLKDVQKTEQSACEETAINDGSLTITLESTLENPAYSYSVILTDGDGKELNRVDDITDFSEAVVFSKLAPGAYKGHLAAKVGDCFVEDEETLFSEPIVLNTETMAVERLTIGKANEDVCKGVASIPFTVAGSTSAATVKVMKGEEKIESIDVAEDGDYTTSALAEGSYKLIYTATNAAGCIEKDEKTTPYRKSQIVLPLKNTQLNVKNSTCKNGGSISGELHFASWSTFPYPLSLVVVDKDDNEIKTQEFPNDIAENSEASRLVNIEDLPAGEYKLKTYFVAEGCKIEPSNATTLWQYIATTKLDGNRDYRSDNTFSVYAPAPIGFTYTAEDVTCADKGASVTFKVENATGTPTVTLYNAEGEAVSTGMTIADLKPDQVYSAKVEDANGCTAEIEEVKVNYKEQPSLESVTAEIEPYHESCFKGNNGRLVATFSGVTSAEGLKFTAVDEKKEPHAGTINAAGTAVRFSELAPGKYTVYVDYDNDGCTSSTPAATEIGTETINAIGELKVDTTSLLPTIATCASPANGRVDIDILNYANGGKITVYQNGSPMWGTIDASVGEYTNGAPCQFYYENEEKKAAHVAHLKIPNVNGGKFTVEVENGCETDKTEYTFDVDELSKPTIQYREEDSNVALNCSGDKDGVLTFYVGGGNANNLVAYVNDEEITPDKSGKCVKDGLVAGTYTLAYKSNVAGCKDAASVEPEITAAIALKATYTAEKVECADQGASVTFKVEGGTGTPTVTLYNAENEPVSTGMTIVGLKPDQVYSAKVSDANGCTIELKDIKVAYKEHPSLEDLTAVIEPYDEACYQGNNGRLVVTFVGVTSTDGLQFTAVDEQKEPHYGIINAAGTSARFDDLVPGKYTVYVDYNSGNCSTSTPAAKELGSATVNPIGKISIDGASLSTVGSCIEPANGRIDLDILNWTKLSTISVYIGSSPIWGTQAASLGEYSGSAPCQFYYENEEKKEAHIAHLKIENLNSGGNYKVIVENDCESDKDTFSFVYDFPSAPSIQLVEAESRLALDCYDSKNGELAFTVAGGNAATFGAYVSEVDETGNLVNAREITADENGKYAAKELAPMKSYMLSYKSKEEGCKDEAKLDTAVGITAPDPVSLTLTVGKVKCEAAGATATAIAGGGTPGYTYAWTNAEGNSLSDTAEVTGLPEGVDYQVVIKDSKKCLVSKKFTVETLVKTPLTSIKVGTPSHKDQTCYNVSNGSISFSFSGNSSLTPLQFVVFDENNEPVAGKADSSSLEKGDIVIDSLAPGTYNVKLAYSFKGCEADDNSITVVSAMAIAGLEEPKFLEKNYSITPNKCENGSEGRMHLEMMGWKDGIYTWTIQRAGESKEGLTENTHHGELLENGATAFDLWSLPEGENVFTMWDGCEKGFRYTKSDTVKADHQDKPELDVVDKVAYTCMDRKDGSFTFVASPWDVADTATFKAGEEKAKQVYPILKDGKAYFEYKEQGTGTYTLTVKDLCKREVELPFDFTEYSEKNGALVAAVMFDADKAKCDLNARTFKISATGGTAPYVYNISKIDGTEIVKTEATENKAYASGLLADGKYTVSITDKTDCKAVYNGDLIIDPAHTMKSLMREVVCGDTKSVMIVSKIDDGKTSGKHFVAVDTDGKTYKANSSLVPIVGISFYTVPTAVQLKGVTAEIDEECSVYAEVQELPLDESALADAKVTVSSQYNERCYQKKNGELTLKYEGPETSYDVMLFLKYTVDGEEKTIETEPQRGKELEFVFNPLAPGDYELYLTHVVGKCDAGVEPRKIQDVHIEALKEPLALFAEKTKVTQSTCYSEMNAQVVVAVTGWVPDTYTEKFYKYKEDGSLEFIWEGTDANDISKDEELKVHAWSTHPNLTAGKYHTIWGDICTPEKVVYDFAVDTLKEPKVEILSSSYTDLKCSYDKAYIDFKYEGGSTLNRRLLFVKDGDWDYTTEELSPEGTYRLYGFTQGPGNQGHEKAEGTTYKLTDEDKGLRDGSYTILYYDSTETCKGDKVMDTVTVHRNSPINILTYSRNVVCSEKAQGSLAFIFNRFKQDGKTLATGPMYTDETYPNKYTGTNWANLMFLPETQQAESYHRGFNAVFGSMSNEDLIKLMMKWGISNPFLLAYYTIEIRKNYPYSSNMFSDVNKIEIISRNRSHEQLYAELEKAVEDSMMKYPLREMYLDGKDYQVPTEWIGFKSLYADFYNVVVTDTFGCRYVSDTVEITVPSYKKPLTIDEVVYDEAAGYCDADKRRITFRVSGGWGDYHYSAVNLDSASLNSSIEELPDDEETEYGKLLDRNYVADGHVESFGTKGTPEYYEIYTTPIQKPGRIRISVVDSLGCKTNGGDYNLTAKYLLSGLTQNDYCSPDENNNYYPLVLNGSNLAPTTVKTDSFKVRIGHRTIREDSVEYRKVLADELLVYDKYVDENDANYYGKSYIEKVPGGQVGFFAYMPDGCSAFNEYDFLSSDNFRKLTLTAEGNLAAKCYNEPTGALIFSIYGGNVSYEKLYLDGRDLMKDVKIESIQKHTVTSTTIYEKDEKVGVNVDTTHSNFSFADFATEGEFTKQNASFDVKPGEESDTKISYYFTLENLVGNTNLVPPFEAKDTSHILIVEDAKGCHDTLDFKVEQPEKLHIEAAGSVMCDDGTGRIFVKEVSGGVGEYEYALDEEPFDSITHKPIVFGSKGHVLFVQDGNGCISEKSNTVSTGEEITWKAVEQDVMISTWHDYGDVLVIIDKTNYHALKYKADNKPFEYHYDSIKVEIIRNDGFPTEVLGTIQPKEYYTYGIKGPSYENVEGGSADVDTAGMHIDATGSVYKYVSWLQKNVYGPTWGIPEEVVVSIKPEDQVNFLDQQYSIEKGALDDSVRNVVDKLCRNCGYLEKLRTMNRIKAQLYKSENDMLKIEQLKTETDNIFNTYHEKAEASLNYDVKVEAMKQKYGFGYGTLSGIRSTFDKLVPDSAAERMTFIKFEEKRKTGSNGTPAESVLEKYFSSSNENESLSFGVRTTTYVSGCDITEEYNPLVLNLKGDEPYPEPNFKNTIRLECSPSVLDYPSEQSTDLKVYMSKDEPFTYQVFGIDGKILKTKTDNTAASELHTNEDGEKEYVYTIKLTGINQTSVVRVFTESNSAATKILVE